MIQTGAPASWRIMKTRWCTAIEARGGDDHAPVAVDEQEGERAEDVEVHLDQPVRLGDEQRGVRHQAAADEHARRERPWGALRQEVGAGGHAAADEDRGQPGAVQDGQPEGGREMEDEQQAEEAVRIATDRAKVRFGRGDRGHVQVIGRDGHFLKVARSLACEAIRRPCRRNRA